MAIRQRKPTAERRRQIAHAALQILDESGVHRLTTAEIARRVGIADGTIFRHFRDKQEIVLAAIDEVTAALFEGFPPQHADPLERLGAFFVDRMRQVREHPEALRLILGERLVEAAGDTGVGRVRALQERAGNFVRECLTEAQAAGLVARDVPAPVLAAMVVGTLRVLATGEAGMARREAPPEAVWTAVRTVLARSTAAG